MNRDAVWLDRRPWTTVAALLLSGCLPKVEFTSCAESGRCSARDAVEAGDARDATVDDLAEATPVDVLDVFDARDATDALDATDASDDLADALDAVEVGDADRNDASDAVEAGADVVDVADVSVDVAADVLRCDAGASVVDGACSVIAAPRPIAPLSTSTVTSQTPRLRWELRPGTDGARIELCRERACATVVHRFEAAGSMTVTPMTLTPGVWFWRVAGTRAGDVGTSHGPTWQFVVGHGSAAVNTSWGNTADFNGDGYADLAVAERQSVLIFYGSPTGVRTTPTVLGVSVSTGMLDFISLLQCAGDLDGDGFPELLVTVRYISDASLGARATLLFPGSSAGVLPTAAITYDLLGYSASPAGDFNLDGYGDLAIDDSLALGSSGGWPTDARTLRPSGAFPSGISIGDTNGDGFGDLAFSGLVHSGGAPSYVSRIYLGNVSGRVATPALEMVGYGSAHSLGDIDGDGYADFSNTSNAGASVVVLRGNATAPVMFTTLNAALISAVGDLDGDGDADVLVSGDVATSLWLGARTSPLSAERRVRNPSGGEMPRAIVRSLGGPGDIDRDGFADFAVAADGWLHVYAGASTISGSPTRSIADVLGASIAN